jgi:hypothetical protein
MIARALIDLSLALATPALAQTTPAAAVPDPARHAAAAELIDLVFPPATRERMVETMMRSIVKDKKP